MEQITNLFIPNRIYQDKHLSPIEKMICALELQYPDASTEELSESLGITKRHFFRLKQNIMESSDKNVTKKDDVQVTPKTTKNGLKPIKNNKNIKKKDDVQVTKKDDVQVTKKDDVQVTKKDDISDTLKHKENVNKVLKFIKTLTSQEIYDEKHKRILEIYTHKELFTEDDFKLFDEKIDEMRSTYEEI